MFRKSLELVEAMLREAIQKLEFYGLLKSKPQSGTFIADIGQVAMNGMIEDIFRIGRA